MHTRRIALLIALTVCAGLASGVRAQEKRASPHETTSATVDGAKISIEYGRPYKKGRTIWGGLNPWGQVWRLGADEATTLTTDKALQVGSLAIPAGKYTLYMWVDEKQPKLVVNKQTGQWGTVYNQDQDLGRVDLQKTARAQPLEQLTISIEQQKTGGGGVLTIAWDNAEYSVPFTVKK